MVSESFLIWEPEVIYTPIFTRRLYLDTLFLILPRGIGWDMNRKSFMLFRDFSLLEPGGDSDCEGRISIAKLCEQW
jgi:hypothetical protein